MAFGRRCDLGCESWPDSDEYDYCAHCGEPTTRYRGLYPLDEDEARSEVAHAKFEAYYEKHCERKGISVDGPLVEAS